MPGEMPVEEVVERETPRPYGRTTFTCTAEYPAFTGRLAAQRTTSGVVLTVLVTAASTTVALPFARAATRT